MKNKNLKIVIIILIVVLVCVTGLCIFLVTDVSNKVNSDSNGKVLNKTKVKSDLKDNKDDSQILNDDFDEKVVGNIDIDSSIVKKLYNYIKSANMIYANCDDNDYVQKFIGIKTNLSGYIYKKNMTSSEIPDDIKIGMVVLYLRKSNKVSVFNKNDNDMFDDYFLIDVDTINKYAKIIFGENTVFDYSNVYQADIDNRISGLYDNNTKYLSYETIGCGGALGSPAIKNKLFNVESNNDEIILYEKTYFTVYKDSKFYVYDNYNEDNIILTFTDGTEFYEFEINCWSNEEISNKASIYKYTFKYDEENKHYYFYSVEKYK